MPITKSAKKALRGSLRKRQFNLQRKRDMMSVVKDIKKLAGAKSKEEAMKLLPKAQKAIDKAAKRGIMKPNNAARKKSRLVKMVKSIS